jgi:O-antigen/teichoic acid export membrane protein
MPVKILLKNQMLFISNKRADGLQNLHQYQCFEKTLLIITKPKKAKCLLKFKMDIESEKYLSAIFLKKIAGRTSFLVAGKIIRLAVQLLVIILFSRKFSYHDYGLYQTAWLYVNIASVISLFGFPSLLLSASSRHIFSWIRLHKKLVAGFGLLLNIAPLLFVFFAAKGFTSVEKICLIYLIIAQNCSLILEAVAIKNEREKHVIISNTIFGAGFFLANWAMLAGYISFTGLFSIVGSCFLLKTMILFRSGKLSSQKNEEVTSATTGRQWFYLGLNDTASVATAWVDKWIILILLSVSDFAVYFNGAYEIPVFGIILGAAGNIMVVEFSKKHENLTKKITDISRTATIFLSSLILPAFCFFLFYNREFFLLIFSEKYLLSLPVFIISIFILPVRITYATAVLQAYNRSDLILKGTLIDLAVSVCLMIILYNVMGMTGLALSFVISTYVQTGFYLWKTAALINCSISDILPVKSIGKIFAISLAATAAGSVLSRYFLHDHIIVPGIAVCVLLISAISFYHYKVSLRAKSH